MHIPDGYIPITQALVYAAIALPFVIKSFLWAKSEMKGTMVPVFATIAAGVFAIQAVNIPMPWGISGHMIGGVLTAILLGSVWAGVLALTLVLTIQALLFADGGVTVLGANILNMGIISTFVGYYLYKGVKGMLGTVKSGFIGAWLGLLTAALITAVELAVAGTFPLVTGLTLMGGYHLVIGLVAEGVITAVVINTVISSAPELFPEVEKTEV